jgi:hypothetical protein
MLFFIRNVFNIIKKIKNEGKVLFKFVLLSLYDMILKEISVSSFSTNYYF